MRATYPNHRGRVSACHQCDVSSWIMRNGTVCTGNDRSARAIMLHRANPHCSRRTAVPLISCTLPFDDDAPRRAMQTTVQESVEGIREGCWWWGWPWKIASYTIMRATITYSQSLSKHTLCVSNFCDIVLKWYGWEKTYTKMNTFASLPSGLKDV